MMLKLFVKSGCPWCAQAEAWLQQHGYRYESVDVLRDADAFAEMRKLSGQSLAPTLDAGDNRILPDFDTDQLEEFLHKHKIAPTHS